VPFFWSEEDVYGAVAASAAWGYPEAGYVVMGGFLGVVIRSAGAAVQASELEGLQCRGLLDSAVREIVEQQNIGCVPLMYVASRLEEVVLPSNQGYAHFAGARITVFRDVGTAEALFEEWRERLLAKGPSYREPLLECDDEAPVGSVAWLCPLGAECRESACVAIKGKTSEEIARLVAEVLGLPLLDVPLGDREWEMWQRDRTPPDAMHDLLS
jgi:hypothetical protein